MRLAAKINELWQYFADKSQKGSIKLVAERFFRVFHDHGVETSQIPRLFPQIRLDDLKSEQALLAILNHDILEQVAKFFGVRTEWLEGVDDVIYKSHTCYKHPETFFEDLAALHWDILHSPVRALVSDINLDCTDRRVQHIALVLLDEIAELGDEIIYRYRVESGEWDWGHPPCRLQLKAMARLAFQKYRITIPIFVVKQQILEAICANKLIPTDYLNGCLCSYPSLEDFGLTCEESSVAKEIEEIPLVMKFIKNYGMENLANKFPRPVAAEQKSDKLQPNRHASEKAKKAATAKNEEGNKLKRAFIEQYAAKIKANEIGQAEAAREFYDTLNERQMMQLCRSARDYENSTPDELRIRGVRTLTNSLRKDW